MTESRALLAGTVHAGIVESEDRGARWISTDLQVEDVFAMVRFEELYIEDSITAAWLQPGAGA